MNGWLTRRAFLAGALGAAAGWALLRDRGPSTDAVAAPGSTAPPTTSTTAPPVAPPTTTTTVAPASATTPATTSTLAPAQIEALCRDAWGARAATGEFTEHTIERMTVHHTNRLLEANSGAPRALRIHQDFHQLERGWSDIAYHYLIDIEGNIYEGRPVRAKGDTGTNYDPTGHFLVACQGDFNQQELLPAQRAALVEVLAWASVEFGVAPQTIAGHRDVAATSCPGDMLYPLIESGELAAAVEQRAAAGPMELKAICGETAFARVAEIENA